MMNGRGSSFHVWLRIRVDLTGGPGKGSGSFAGVTGRAVFEWVLAGQFLVERSEVLGSASPESSAPTAAP